MSGQDPRPTLLLISPFARAWSQGERGGVADEIHFIDGFREAGWQVHVIAPRSDDSAAYPGAETHSFPNFFHRTRSWPVAVRRVVWPLLFQLLVIPRAERVARRLRPAFILGLSHYTTPVTWWCGRRLGIPRGTKLAGVMDLVHTEWARAKYVFKNFEQLVALRFTQDAWIVLDDGTDGERVLRANGIDPGRIHFLPNGMNTEWAGTLPDRANARVAIGISREAHVVVFVARLVASKRPDHVLRALPGILSRTDLDVHLVVVGDGPERNRCERLAEKYNAVDRVHFVGAVPHDDIPLYMAAADVFVSTSNLTNAAIPTCEAMVCGIPPVVYNVGTTAQTVKNNETGLSVADGDVDALAGAVSALLIDDDLRERLANGSREFAKAHFTSWPERIGREVELISSLAGIEPRG